MEFPSVVRERVVWVVPAGSWLVGEPLDKNGGVASDGGEIAAPGSQLPHCAPLSDSSPSSPNRHISQTCWFVKALFETKHSSI